jgi:hypothetical protein
MQGAVDSDLQNVSPRKRSKLAIYLLKKRLFIMLKTALVNEKIYPIERFI